MLLFRRLHHRQVGMGRFHAVALDEGEEVQKFGGRHIGCRRRRCRRAILVVGFVLGGEDDDSPLGFRWRLARERLGGNAIVVVRLLLCCWRLIVVVLLLLRCAWRVVTIEDLDVRDRDL